MSKLYATITSDTRRTQATSRGHRHVSVTAASWHGAITVELTIGEDGIERFTVRQRLWHGAGVNQLLASGVIGHRVADTTAAPSSEPSHEPERIAAE